MARILVVDDSAVDRRFVGGLLSRDFNYLVEFAEDGADALTKIRQAAPDLIVTDLQMPNRNGLELVSAVRLHHSGIPIILMTGHGSEGLAVEALQRGAAGYVPKPQLGECLLDAVAQALLLAQADSTYERLIACLQECEFDFELENDSELVDALVDLIQQMATGMRLTDATGRFRLGAAVKEAVQNAIFRGNLELSYSQAIDVRGGGLSDELMQIVLERRMQSPYCDRRVVVQVRMNSHEARFVIRDSGKGFKGANHAPPASNSGILESRGGRGLVLMRAFMDQVMFNDQGNEVTLVMRREAAVD
jgi:CheY-like chemotaxis protein